MNSGAGLSELLDRLLKGTISEQDRQLLEKGMESDPVFRREVENQLELVGGMRAFHERMKVKSMLDEWHKEMQEVAPASVAAQNKPGLIRRIWPMTAVAASVAIISIIGTLMITRSLETKQTAYYKELRRNVDQIKRSQNLILQDIAQSKEKAKPTNQYAGTGFLVSRNGYIATSYHVVKDADSVYIENENFGNIRANIVYSDPQNDVSILKVERSDFMLMNALPFTLAVDEANLGEPAFTLGYPREDIVFGEGSVSASTGYRQNANAYQVSVPVNPGNSGGPLFNVRGDVIGMISGIQTETSGATFAIKSSVLLGVCQQTPIDTLAGPLVLPQRNTLRYLSRVDQVKKWREYVFMVRVYNN